MQYRAEPLPQGAIAWRMSGQPANNPAVASPRKPRVREPRLLLDDWSCELNALKGLSVYLRFTRYVLPNLAAVILYVPLAALG